MTKTAGGGFGASIPAFTQWRGNCTLRRFRMPRRRMSPRISAAASSHLPRRRVLLAAPNLILLSLTARVEHGDKRAPCLSANHKIMQYLLKTLVRASFLAANSLLLAADESVALNLSALHNPVWTSKDNLRDPSVLKTKQGYHLFYSRFSSQTIGWGDPRNWHIAEVFTKDFLTFTNDRDISPAGCASPGDVVWWQGRWVLPYQTYPSKPTQLVFAESTNLIEWSAPRPFLAEVLTLPWNGLQRVIDPSFVVDGDTLHCWFVGSAYHTNENGNKFKVNLMGHAVTHDPKLETWEVTTPTTPLLGISTHAPDGVENTMIFRTEDHWTMIYSEGLISQHLTRATSPDLVNWRLEGPVKIPRQKWMAHKYGAPFVWRDGDQWLMILMGTVAEDHTAFGLLSSTDGEHWLLLPEWDSDERK